MTPAHLQQLLPLRTERLVLRVATDDDVEDLLAHRGDTAVHGLLRHEWAPDR